MFNFDTAKIAPLYKFLWNLSLLPRWEVSLLWNWGGPRHRVESRMLAAWHYMASEPRLENAIHFFPGSHKTTSCGALRFQVRSLKHSAMGKPKARNTKLPAKAPRLQRERAKVSGESSAASAPIQQHLHRMCQRTSKASYLQVLDTYRQEKW